MSVTEIDRRVLKEEYRNYDLVARHWKGEYRGRIWKKKESFEEFYGQTLEEIIQHMRDTVDKHIDQKIGARGADRPSIQEFEEAFSATD